MDSDGRELRRTFDICCNEMLEEVLIFYKYYNNLMNYVDSIFLDHRSLEQSI